MDRLPPIVCGVDEGYVLPLCVLMESLAAAHPGHLAELRLIVLHRLLSERWTDRIYRHAHRLGLAVEMRKVPQSNKCLPIFGRWTRAVYLRLEIGDVIPDEPVVLYLDVDTLILDDLRPLLCHDLSGATLAAVRDPGAPLVGHGIALRGWRELGLPSDREYFNSGLMLLDLEECRGRDLFARSRQFLIERPDSALLPDQDALNWAADDSWMRLDRRWNTFALSPLVAQPWFVHPGESVMPLDVLIDDEPDAAVLHFTGDDKPWTNSYPTGHLADLYRSFLERITNGGTDAILRQRQEIR